MAIEPSETYRWTLTVEGGPALMQNTGVALEMAMGGLREGSPAHECLRRLLEAADQAQPTPCS